MKRALPRGLEARELFCDLYVWRDCICIAANFLSKVHLDSDIRVHSAELPRHFVSNSTARRHHWKFKIVNNSGLLVLRARSTGTMRPSSTAGQGLFRIPGEDQLYQHTYHEE